MIELVLDGKVSNVKKDPRERIAELFDAMHDRLYRIALRMVSDDEAARDLVQETFLRAAQKSATIPEGTGSAEGWLVRVLVNLCKDQYRRRKVRRDHAVSTSAPRETHDHEAAVVAASTVRKALERLNPKRRAVIVLHDLEGLDDNAVAKLLGVAAVTVRWHLSKGRGELAEIIRPDRST